MSTACKEGAVILRYNNSSTPAGAIMGSAPSGSVSTPWQDVHLRGRTKPNRIYRHTGISKRQHKKPQTPQSFSVSRSGMSYISPFTWPWTNTKEDTSRLQGPTDLQPGNLIQSCCEWVSDLQASTTVNFLDWTLSKEYGTWISTDIFSWNVAEGFYYIKGSWIINRLIGNQSVSLTG